mmetsp:Transcript_27493/g.55009  ORF Transcript_27493/g.55009 Transcript_27493/m.55009 type:complete len:311 (-) Transcript_27493:1713-2645(-)
MTGTGRSTGTLCTCCSWGRWPRRKGRPGRRRRGTQRRRRRRKRRAEGPKTRRPRRTGRTRNGRRVCGVQRCGCLVTPPRPPPGARAGVAPAGAGTPPPAAPSWRDGSCTSCRTGGRSGPRPSPGASSDRSCATPTGPSVWCRTTPSCLPFSCTGRCPPYPRRTGSAAATPARLAPRRTARAVTRPFPPSRTSTGRPTCPPGPSAPRNGPPRRHPRDGSSSPPSPTSCTSEGRGRSRPRRRRFWRPTGSTTRTNSTRRCSPTWTAPCDRAGATTTRTRGPPRRRCARDGGTCGARGSSPSIPPPPATWTTR